MANARGDAANVLIRTSHGRMNEILQDVDLASSSIQFDREACRCAAVAVAVLTLRTLISIHKAVYIVR